MFSNKHMKRNVSILVAVAAVTGWGLWQLARADEGQSPHRTVTLSPTAGPPFDTASGTVSMFLPNAGNPGCWIGYQLQGLVSQGGENRDMAYALYGSTGDGPPRRLATFNTNWQVYHAFAGLPGDCGAWLDDTITMEVYIEADDGYDAPDVGGLLVLDGEDPGA